jgi:2-haloacid dehalogenase
MTDLSGIRALTFDVFGTVVDWRSGIIRDGEALGRAKGLAVDWARFADAWRGLYQPALSQVRDGTRPWTKLDDLHRESLERLLAEFGIAGLSETEIDALNRAWHRLDPWPDAIGGMTRLKRRYILVTLSNGNVALLVNMAKRAGLPWGRRARRRGGALLQAAEGGLSRHRGFSRPAPGAMPDGRGALQRPRRGGRLRFPHRLCVAAR